MTTPATSSPSQATRHSSGRKLGGPKKRSNASSDSSDAPQWSRNASMSAAQILRWSSGSTGRISRPSGIGMSTMSSRSRAQHLEEPAHGLEPLRFEQSQAARLRLEGPALQPPVDPQAGGFRRGRLESGLLALVAEVVTQERTADAPAAVIRVHLAAGRCSCALRRCHPWHAPAHTRRSRRPSRRPGSPPSDRSRTGERTSHPLLRRLPLINAVLSVRAVVHLGQHDEIVGQAQPPEAEARDVRCLRRQLLQLAIRLDHAAVSIGLR